jgi:hypothetical protein
MDLPRTFLENSRPRGTGSDPLVTKTVPKPPPKAIPRLRAIPRFPAARDSLLRERRLGGRFGFAAAGRSQSRPQKLIRVRFRRKKAFYRSTGDPSWKNGPQGGHWGKRMFKPKDWLPQISYPNEIDVVFGLANPNPDRVGCPSRDALVALSRRERPIGDPAYDHLIRCSPCYLDVRELQEADARERRRRVLRPVK